MNLLRFPRRIKTLAPRTGCNLASANATGRPRSLGMSEMRRRTRGNTRWFGLGSTSFATRGSQKPRRSGARFKPEFFGKRRALWCLRNRLSCGSLCELGRGAMDITYRATDTSLQRKVALKLIKTEVAERRAVSLEERLHRAGLLHFRATIDKSTDTRSREVLN